MKSLAAIIAANDTAALAEWIAAHRTGDEMPPLPEPPAPTREQLLARIQIPPLYHEVIPSEQPPTQGRLYTGRPGIGKTHRATADLIALANAGKRCRWLSLPAYMAAIRVHEPVPSLDSLCALDALLLDDVAQAKPPEWMRDSLYSLIDGLLNHRVLVIATSNADRVAIARTYGDPIASRLAALCPDTVEMDGYDRRLSL